MKNRIFATLMNIFKSKIPPFLYKKNNLIILVIFTAIFALLFINLYHPFSSTEWYPLTKVEYFLYSSLLIITGVLVVLISRIVMYKYTKTRTITYFQYGCWILVEILLMSLLYTTYSYILEETRNFLEVLEDSVVNTSLVILLPYTICTLYFSLQEKSRILKEISQKSDGKTGKGDTVQHNSVSFYDEKGELRLSLKRESLLYIESADNYVTIWYIGNNHELTRFMLRNSMKNMEEELEKLNILRCHRSYMVNMNNVNVVRRGKSGITLSLETDRVPEIPVSNGYSRKITEWFINA